MYILVMQDLTAKILSLVTSPSVSEKRPQEPTGNLSNQPCIQTTSNQPCIQPTATSNQPSIQTNQPCIQTTSNQIQTTDPYNQIQTTDLPNQIQTTDLPNQIQTTVPYNQIQPIDYGDSLEQEFLVLLNNFGSFLHVRKQQTIPLHPARTNSRSCRLLCTRYY
jgi:hypothetical protein